MTTKILLADDSVTIQKVVELTFSDKNYEVTTVGDGESAIRMAREKRPDIILLDVIMPGMDGYEVCSVLKQDAELKAVPVLLLTGTFEVFDTERSQRVGADGYITKPFESQELIARVRRLVSQHQTEASAAEDDLDADLMLPELEERYEAPELRGGTGRSGEEEDFPEFTFDEDNESLDSEILFDFSADTASAAAATREAPHPAASREAAAPPAGPRKEAPAAPMARSAAGLDYNEDDEPTFELPEFDLPDEESAGVAAATSSAWDDEDRELTSNLAAITMRAPRGPSPKAPAKPGTRVEEGGGAPAEEEQFVFEEAPSPPRREAQRAAVVDEAPSIPPPSIEERPSIELGPLLQRLERLETAIQAAVPAAQGVTPLLERMSRIEALLQERPALAAASGSGNGDALEQQLPRILDHISATVGAQLPALVDRAAERLSAQLAERFVERLGGGLDTREIVSAIAWQVVPDVAEMLVRREIEEIRRHI
jgi:DNA-binding response OmpR family regulator